MSAVPNRCPVCDGTGRVEHVCQRPGEVQRVTCHGCRGDGVLWGEQDPWDAPPRFQPESDA